MNTDLIERIRRRCNTSNPDKAYVVGVTLRDAEALVKKDAEILRLRGALEWYADPHNWKNVVGKYPPKTSWGALDNGSRAKAALKGGGK